VSHGKIGTRRGNTDSGNIHLPIDRLNAEAWKRVISVPREGMAIARRAHERAVEAGYDKGVADALLSLAWGANYLADYQQALDFFEDARMRYRTLRDTAGELKSLNGLGVIHHNIGDLDGALDYFRRGLELSKGSSNANREAVSLNNIGEVCEAMGRSVEALEYFASALETAQSQDDLELQSIVTMNVGRSYHKAAKFELAREYLERALEMSERADDEITHARCLTLLGLVFQEQDDFKTADAFHRRSLEICEQTENRLGKIDALQHLGQLQQKAGTLDDALVSYRAAVSLSQEIGTVLGAYECWNRIGEIQESQSKYQEALESQKEYHTALRKVFTEESELKLKTLSLQHEKERAQSESEIYRLRNVELRQKSVELEEANRRLTIISKIGRDITASLNLEELMYTIYSHINKLLDATIFGIALYHRDRSVIEYKFFIERSKRLESFERPLSSEESFGAWAIRNNREVVMNDVDAEYRQFVKVRPENPGAPAGSIIYLPLNVKNRTIGLVTVQSYEKNAYNEYHMDMLRALASYIAIALDNSLILHRVSSLSNAVRDEKEQLEQAYEEIRHMATHDNLTGLPNRRFLFDLLEEYIPMARRLNQKFAVYYIDLDDFKPVNDSYGHAVGDAVLKEIGGRLKSTLRASDTVARIGGDEFIAVIKDVTSRATLNRMARKLLSVIADPVTVKEHEEITLGASIGISIFPDDHSEIAGLVGYADEAMYRSKQHHRNSFNYHNSTARKK